MKITDNRRNLLFFLLTMITAIIVVILLIECKSYRYSGKYQKDPKHSH